MTRRDCLILATAPGFQRLRTPKNRGYSGYALIATSGEDSLAVVDLQNFRLLKSIPLGAPPTAVVPAHTVSGSYVLTPSTDSVHLIDGNLRVAISRRFGGQALGNSSGSRWPDAARDRQRLARTDSCRSRFFACRAPYQALRSAGQFRLLPKTAMWPFRLEPAGSSNCSIWRAASAVASSAREPSVPVRFRGDGRLLLVSDLVCRSILALDVPSLEIVAELPLAMRPDNLCFNADQGQLFVSGVGMDGIAIVFPYDVLEVNQTVLAGRDPGVMACSDTPAYLFVASASGSDVCIMNIDARKIIGLVEIGGRPTYITITPGDQFALVA